MSRYHGHKVTITIIATTGSGLPTGERKSDFIRFMVEQVLERELSKRLRDFRVLKVMVKVM
ncbi:MAG: hypothetical protein DRJ40_07295 [Thermoprotei archaeon]|nr:MAG: hypothetical protein DRJ40_07295 [Thermoprotei archaeon]